MIDELTHTAKQVGLELINLSDVLAEEMQTWADLLAQNPESITATISAGFITKPSVETVHELVIDVQAPPDETAVVRTWAIATRAGEDGQVYSDSIQLTFNADNQRVSELVAKGAAVTKDDIRHILQGEKTGQLARIAVSNKVSGDGTKQTHGERYDFTGAELSKNPENAAKVSHALQEVLETLKQSAA